MDAHQPQICPLSGMCSNLHATYERSFPRVSDPDAECASHEPEAGDGNDGGQDAPPERQSSPSPTCPENEDALSERQLSPKSPGVAGVQPESLPTPKSPEPGTARDDYMLPELPRFSPVGMPSTARVDDSPFKTCSQTPPSRLGGTGYTERTPSDSNYSLPGQSTAHTMASLFPINEDDLPEIHGLISTPGGVSSVGTGVTGLGSMSARTRYCMF
jgi:cohesin complex subunit SCC1